MYLPNYVFYVIIIILLSFYHITQGHMYFSMYGKYLK